MIDLTLWMPQFLIKLKETFGERIWFVGLQGSYGRGEATPNSDLDLVVILDQMTSEDLRTYSLLLDTLPERELLCGFIAGKEEIANWDAADFFQFYFDTKPICGSMEELKKNIDEQAVKRAIHMGVCNIYHGCAHNMVHGKDESVLAGLYKAASFVVQAICYLQTGEYVTHLHDLEKNVEHDEKKIIETFRLLKNGGKIDFVSMSDQLFAWAGMWIKRV